MDVFFWLAGFACLATLAVLVVGIGGFGTGKITPQGQNKIMRLRIAAQFVAIVFIMIAILVSKDS